MAKGSQIRKRPVPAKPGWQASVLVVAALVGLVASFGTRGQAQAVDLAAAWLGVAGLLGSAATWSVWRTRGVPVPSRLAVSVGSFVLWLLAASVLSGRGWSAFAGETTSGLGWLSVAALVAVALGGWVSAEHSALLAGRYAWLVVLGESLALFLQRATGADLVAGTLPNSTYFGEAILLLLPWTLSDEPSGRGLARWRQEGVSLLAVTALAASGARVAAVAGAVWLVWAAGRRLNGGRRLRLAVAAVVMVAVVAAGLVFAADEVLGSAGVNAAGKRPQMWAAAVVAVAARPALGWGADGFLAGGAATVSRQLTRAGLVFGPGSTDPHNLLVWVAVSAGLVGLALFCWLAVEVVLAWRHRPRPAYRGPAVSGVVMFLFVLLTAPAAVQVLPLFGLMLGISLGGAQAPPVAAGARKVSMLVGSAVLAVASFVLAANMLTRAPLETPGPDASVKVAPISLAVTRVWPFDAHLAYLASLHTGFAVVASPGLVAEGVDLAQAQRAADLDARNPFYALELARTRRFYRQPAADVDTAFRETLRRYPALPLAHAEYAASLASAGRRAEALRQIELAEALDAGDPQVQAALDSARKALDAPRP